MQKTEKTEFATHVQYLPGVGPKTAKRLAKLGVDTIGDLIYYFPRKYLDYSDIGKIADITNPNIQGTSYDGGKFQTSGDTGATIKARVIAIGNRKTRRRGFTVTEAVVEDESAALKVVWFNQPYLHKTLYVGREIILHGKVGYDQFSQGHVMESPDWALQPKIVPIYRETEGVSSYYVSKLISLISKSIAGIDDFLPEYIIKQNDLLTLEEAIRILHGPSDMAELERARERMAFDELFLISLRGQILKQALKKDKAPAIPSKQSKIEKFITNLPYKLTHDQEEAWHDISKDLGCETPMNRLLNGDVGSGKTIVSALASLAVWSSGRSVLLMAPTEILANQHFETFKRLFNSHDIPVELVTSATKKLKPETKKIGLKATSVKGFPGKLGLTEKAPKIYIGTHALLFMDELLEEVGLVVVDEQHRFGVRQRQALKELAHGQQVPHFLSMTATPIPRSLQLALFAELDVSLIQEKPADRKEIKTRVVDEANRNKAYEFIRAHVKAGRQVFVICPLIEETQNLDPKTESENLELFEIDCKTVAGEYEKLSIAVFPELHIGMLHGKMKGAEKDEIMSRFASRELDILVSTSVVEVGVDIPNASIMMIEDADRFGLAQLHQFRGRVGRGEHQSFCLLFTSSRSQKTLERIQLMEQISDGFKLAEYDLKNRGAGDIFGVNQSGFIDIKFADLTNAILIAKASQSAKMVAEQSPDLQGSPLVKSKLEKFISAKHFE